MEPRAHQKRRIVAAAGGFLLGLGLLISSIKLSPWVGLLGFVLMLASAFFALSSRQAAGSPDRGTVRGATARSTSRRPRQRRAGFMNRVEDRWNRRREQDGR